MQRRIATVDISRETGGGDIGRHLHSATRIRRRNRGFRYLYRQRSGTAIYARTETSIYSFHDLLQLLALLAFLSGLLHYLFSFLAPEAPGGPSVNQA